MSTKYSAVKQYFLDKKQNCFNFITSHKVFFLSSFHRCIMDHVLHVVEHVIFKAFSNLNYYLLHSSLSCDFCNFQLG